MNELTGPTRRPSLTRRNPPDKFDKARRGLWYLVYIFLFRPTPSFLHNWRCLLLRLFGAKIGARVSIYSSSEIWAPWNLTLGTGATVGGKSKLYTVGPIFVCEQAIISQGAHLCTATHDQNSQTFDLMVGPITVEANAWVAAEAFIGPGVTIGQGAVVAARAVVLRSVAPAMIVAGNPAKVVSKRMQSGKNVLAGRTSK